MVLVFWIAVTLWLLTSIAFSGVAFYSREWRLSKPWDLMKMRDSIWVIKTSSPPIRRVLVYLFAAMVVTVIVMALLAVNSPDVQHSIGDVLGLIERVIGV
jgi:hypothetical protein